MPAIRHHVPEPLLVAYAAGSLGHAFALVVAAHVSLCVDCRARLAAVEAAGGVVLDGLEGAAVSQGVKAALMARLDEPSLPPPPLPARSGIYPGPVALALGGQAPKWRKLGGGVRQMRLHHDGEGSLRLLFIPPGRAVPDHGHGGLELTLVLQGSFTDQTGRFGAGDVEVANHEIDHRPVAGSDKSCICLAATDAPLRFAGIVPRLLQPLFGI